MEYRQFKYVLKIAELGNLTKAASELYISQSSLSHYLARLEEEIGVRLFDRSKNPIALTAAGERYCETARMILKLDARLRKEVSDIAKNKAGRITLGMSHARAAYFLPYLFPEFLKSYPGIELRTIEQSSGLLEKHVYRGSCDLAVLPLPLSGSFDLKSEPVMREELLLVSGRELPNGSAERTESDLYPLRKNRQYVDFSTLQGRPFTLLKPGHGIRTALEAIFMEHDLRPGPVFETTSNETAYRLATAGMGIAIVPESTVLLSKAVSRSHLYSLTERGLYWQIAVVFRDEDCLTEPQKYLISLMKRHFGERRIGDGEMTFMT